MLADKLQIKRLLYPVTNKRPQQRSHEFLVIPFDFSKRFQCAAGWSQNHGRVWTCGQTIVSLLTTYLANQNQNNTTHNVIVACIEIYPTLLPERAQAYGGGWVRAVRCWMSGGNKTVILQVLLKSLATHVHEHSWPSG